MTLLLRAIVAPDDPEVHRGVKLFERLGKFLAEIRELDARIALAPDDDQTIADRAMLAGGADCTAFDSMVQAGPRSAYNLARPTDRIVQPGDLVMTDIGRAIRATEPDVRTRVLLHLAIATEEKSERRCYLTEAAGLNGNLIAGASARFLLLNEPA